MIQQKGREQRAGKPASPGDLGLSILMGQRRKLDKMALHALPVLRCWSAIPGSQANHFSEGLGFSFVK